MAFNVENYIKKKSKPVLRRVADETVSRVTSGLPNSTRNLAESMSTALLNSGSSYNVVDALAGLKIDSIISGAADEFFQLAGKAVNRTGSKSLGDLRSIGKESTMNYLTEINPATKILSKKNKDSQTTLSVI